MQRFGDSYRVDLHEIFLRIQEQMLGNLASSKVFEHRSACGTATERHWIELLNRYLPQRYRATNAFVIDADGERSRQIDIAIYDHFYSPHLFHDESQPYVPAESVYAVFEVKQNLAPTVIWEAGQKAASVRRLRRTSAGLLSAGFRYPPRELPPILAGIVCLDTGWTEPFAEYLTPILGGLRVDQRLDLGCCLRHRSFEVERESREVLLSKPQEALIFFMLRLIQRLQQMGAAPAIDFGEYGRSLEPERTGTRLDKLH